MTRPSTRPSALPSSEPDSGVPEPRTAVPPPPTATDRPTGDGRAAGRRRSLVPDFRYRPVIATGVLVVLLLVFGTVRYAGFLDLQVLLNLLVDSSYLIVLAVGMTFVVLTGGIDLSVGAVLALTTMVVAQLLQAGLPAAVVIPLALVVGSVLGLVVGLLVQVFEVQPFIASLAAMFLARGACFLISTDSIPITDPFFATMAGSLDLGPYSVSYGALIALVLVAVAFVVLHHTRFGRTVYAIGSGDNSAELMGLRVARTRVLVYVVSGLCASLAGLLFTLYLPSGNSLHGLGMELDAIAAVVIGGSLLAGGYGFVMGSLLGVLVLATIKAMILFEGDLSSWWTRIVTGALLFVFIVLQRFMTVRRR